MPVAFQVALASIEFHTDVVMLAANVSVLNAVKRHTSMFGNSGIIMSHGVLFAMTNSSALQAAFWSSGLQDLIWSTEATSALAGMRCKTQS